MRAHFSPKTIAEIAAHAGGRVVGDAGLVVTGLAGIANAKPGDLAFIDSAKRLAESGAMETAAACVLVPEGVELEGPALIVTREPKLAFARVAQWLLVEEKRPRGTSASAEVAPSAEVDGDAHIGPRAVVGDRARIGAGSAVLAGAVIGSDVVIGRDCVIHPNAVLYDDVELGDRVVVHAGAVLGADGFGYVRAREGYQKFPQIGRVIIGDDVEIGANSCIDRGALRDTRVGDGTKIDNLAQIAHNVEIGKRTAISAQVGIAGSVQVGDDVVVGGQAGMGDRARVASGAVIAARAGVTPNKAVRPGVWWGMPVQPLEEAKQSMILSRRLPKLFEELKELRAKVEELLRK